MNTVPSYTLEVHAVDQRRRLQSSIAELRSRVREILAINDERIELQRAPLVSRLIASLVVLRGYGLTRYLFSTHRRRKQMKSASPSR